MKNWFICFALLFSATTANATHEAGGQISSRYLSASEQEVKITLWIDSTGTVQNTITYAVQNGGTSQNNTASLSSSTAIGNALMQVIYRDTLSLTTAGTYKLVYSSCCRSNQISNLTNPAMQLFYIYTQFEYNNTLNNSTPEFLNTPDFFAGVNDTFLHNPLAADVDNDAMLFYTNNVLGNNGQAIPYNFVPFPNSGWAFGIDSLNGELHWIPSMTGKYAYTIRVDEWRNGVMISSSLRDALINACNGCKTTMSSDFTFQTDGWPNNGQNVYLNTYANTPFSFTFNGSVSSLNTNTLTMSLPSQPDLHQNKPTFTSVQSGQSVSGTLQWTPQTSQVNNDPYLAVIVGKETNTMNQVRQKERTVYIKVNPGQANGTNNINTANINVYPNPAKQNICIDFNTPQEAIDYIDVRNINGQVVFRHSPKTPTGTILIDVQSWTPGVYFIHTQGRVDLRKTIVIQH